jgi:heptaprenyl diphosphate synthase
MRTGYSHEKLAALAENASFLVLALALSYVEALIPLSLLIPIPGVKLGLANLAVLLAVYRNGFFSGAAVSLARVILSAVLFGSVSSLAFSLGGALLSLLMLALLRPLYGRFCSWIGISAACAAAHNGGQILVAAFWMHDSAVFLYLPVLFAAAAVTGTLTGVMANLAVSHLPPKEKRSTS